MPVTGVDRVTGLEGVDGVGGRGGRVVGVDARPGVAGCKRLSGGDASRGHGNSAEQRKRVQREGKRRTGARHELHRIALQLAQRSACSAQLVGGRRVRSPDTAENSIFAVPVPRAVQVESTCPCVAPPGRRSWIPPMMVAHSSERKSASARCRVALPLTIAICESPRRCATSRSPRTRASSVAVPSGSCRLIRGDIPSGASISISKRESTRAKRRTKVEASCPEESGLLSDIER